MHRADKDRSAWHQADMLIARITGRPIEAVEAARKRECALDEWRSELNPLIDEILDAYFKGPFPRRP